MEKIPAFDPIEFLVTRRFGPVAGKGHLTLASLSMPGRRRLYGAPDDPAFAREVEEYRSALEFMTPSELQVHVDAERVKLSQEQEREEQARFYNQSYANADFDHWSKAAHWTLDEAIALSFGKAPEVVQWEKLQTLQSLGSTFLFQYRRRRDLALRAMTWKQLFDPVLPSIFLTWAKRIEIEVPPALIEAVERRGIQVADWQSRYDEAMALLKRQGEQHQSQIADWEKLYADATAARQKENSDWRAIAERKSQTIASLEERISKFQHLRPAANAEVEKELRPKERDSLLKLVIGMACDGYGYDPKASRSKQAGEIASGLVRFGISLDEDTIRKWLRESAELLPPK